MVAHTKLVRAISSEFVARKLRVIASVIALSLLAAVSMSLWLTTVNVWWWLLAAPVIMCTLLIAGALCVALAMVKMLRPTMTHDQKSGTIHFVDKLERVAEHVQTPTFILIFRVLRDMIRPRGRTFIESAAEDSTTLHTDLAKLERLFQVS